MSRHWQRLCRCFTAITLCLNGLGEGRLGFNRNFRGIISPRHTSTIISVCCRDALAALSVKHGPEFTSDALFWLALSSRCAGCAAAHCFVGGVLLAAVHAH